ncbi:hypothetical protein JCM10213v2_001880 [Rhodosporidiobolus nylandii]
MADKDKPAIPPKKDTPAGPKKRKLACPGEPAPKKRLRKGELPPREGPSEVELRMSKHQLGAAATFHLVESHLRSANPYVPGLPYDFFRDFLKTSGGSSKEAEIAAESVVGNTDLDAPSDSPLGAQYNYMSYHPFGQKRRDCVEALSLNARQIFEDSGMRFRPSMEALYALLVMDQMTLLTSERGRQERDFVDIAAKHWRTLLAKKGGLKADQVAMLEGPIGVEILALDAQAAAVLRQPCIITDSDLAALVPHLSLAGASMPVLNPQSLLDEETGWTELGKQMAPLSLSTTALYRAFNRLDLAAFANPATLTPFYTALDASYAFLASAAHLIASLPPLPEPLDHAFRAFDLFGLLNSYRRSLIRLDLLAGQRVIECSLASQVPPASKDAQAAGAANPPPAPSPSLLMAYETSRQRVQRAFVLAAELARHAVETSCLDFAKRLYETLEVCSSWTSMRNAEPVMAAELCRELGIGAEMGPTLLQLCSLCSWSTYSASQLHKGLTGGLTLLLNAPPPPPPYPPPPGVVTVNGKTVRTAPPSGFSGLFAAKGNRKERRRAYADTARKAMAAAERKSVYKPPLVVGALKNLAKSAMAKGKGKVRDVEKEKDEFVQDWSFLDAFATPASRPSTAGDTASMASGSSSSQATSSAASTKASLSRYPRSLAPTASRASTSSSASSANARKRTISPVQAQLEAAAAPLRFSRPRFMQSSCSRSASAAASSARTQSIHQVMAPPHLLAHPQQHPRPSPRPLSPPGPLPHVQSSATPIPPAQFSLPPQQPPQMQQPSHMQQIPSPYPVVQPPPPRPQSALAYPPVADGSFSLSPTISTPQPHPPSHSPSAPQAYFHSPTSESGAYQPSVAEFSAYTPQPGVADPSSFASSSPSVPSPSFPQPMFESDTFDTSAGYSLHDPHLPHTLPSPTPMSTSPYPSFAGTPNSAYVSYASPALVVDTPVGTLGLDPLDEQTLALLASLPQEGGDVAMGSPAMAVQHAVQEWGMQGTEDAQYTHQQQHQQHSQWS